MDGEVTRQVINPINPKTRKSPKKKASDSLGRTPFRGKFRWKRL